MAIAAAGALGAVGSIAGGALAKPDDPDPRTSYYYPGSDPVLAGLSLEAMIGLGLPPTYIMEQASPVNQVINRLNMSPNLPSSIKTKAINALAKLSGGEPIDATDPDNFRAVLSNFSKLDRKALSEALGVAGLTRSGLEGLFAQEAQYQQQTQGILEQVGGSQQGIFEGRLSTQEAIGNLMSEIAGLYGGGESPLVGRYMRTLEADINQTYDKQMEDVLRMASVAGYNPGRALSDLADSRASALRNLQHQGTLQAESILGLLQGSLQPAQQTAGGVAGMRTSQGVGAAGVAGNQASTINSIQAQVNAQQAQAMGAGVAGGFQSGADALLLSGLLNRHPGTSPQPTQPGPWDSGYVFP
jgi:hypothetical protein